MAVHKYISNYSVSRINEIHLGLSKDNGKGKGKNSVAHQFEKRYSWIYHRRAIPLYFVLLDKKGNSSLSEQTESLSHVITKFKKYKVVLLGDREFFD